MIDVVALRELRDGVLRLKWKVAALRFDLFMRRLAYASALKANFNPNQPRVPAGVPEGGQWTDSGWGTSRRRRPAEQQPGGSEPRSIREPLRITVRPRPQDGGDPAPLDNPPDIPLSAPPTTYLKNRVVIAAASWLLRAAIREAANPVAGTVLNAIEAAYWIHDSVPYIRAYLDAPKTLEELQQVGLTRQRGYDIHHIVEKTPAESDGFPEARINSPENLVRIPTLRHWELNAWYERSNPLYGGQTPRAYLRGKEWDERVRVGLEGLRRVGVLTR